MSMTKIIINVFFSAKRNLFFRVPSNRLWRPIYIVTECSEDEERPLKVFSKNKILFEVGNISTPSHHRNCWQLLLHWRRKPFPSNLSKSLKENKKWDLMEC